jgi:transposase
MIVQMDFGHELFTGVLYVFRNRTSTKLKILFWENNGFVLYYKTLAEEEFHWPSSSDAPLTITSEQLKFLVNSYVISRMKQHKTLRNDSVC